MTINYWIFVLLTVCLLGFIGYGTYQTAQLLRNWQPDRNLLLMPAENLVRLGLIAFCVGLGLLSGLPRAQLGWITAGWLGQSGWGLLWGAGLALFFYLTTGRLVRASADRFYSAVIIKSITPTNRRELGLVLLAMGPVVLLEELLFRSLLIGGLAPILPLPLLLIGWSVLFGLLHLPQGVWGMVGAGLAGLVLALLFVQAGTLVLPLVAHYVTNMVQVIQAMRLRAGAQPYGTDSLPGVGEEY